MSTSQSQPSLSSKKVLVLHRLSQKENNKEDIHKEIESFFNSTNKFLAPTSKLVVGKKIHFKEMTKICNTPPRRSSITKKRNPQPKKTKNSSSEQQSYLRSGVFNLMEDFINQNELTNNVEIIDNKKLKSIFDSFKECSTKSSANDSNIKILTSPSANIPQHLKIKLSFQSKNLEEKEKNERKISKVSKYVSHKSHKSECDLLMNRIDCFRVKKEILNNFENSKPLDQKYGRHKWAMSLRRPDRFHGSRETYVNLNTDTNPFWAVVRERYPQEKTISIKPGSNLKQKEFIDFLSNPYLSSSTHGENSIKVVENIDDLTIRGTDLFELEYNEAMRTKGNKILHKVFFDNGKAILEKDVNDLFGEKMIYKNYSEKSAKVKG